MICQSAAIPLRLQDTGRVEVLLVTSRRRQRWILPKGHIATGMSAHESAAKEAYEEGGVTGPVATIPAGSYRTLKRRVDGSRHTVIVVAYPLFVSRSEEAWPEMDWRRRRWVPVPSGLDIIDDAALHATILTAYRRLIG
jgi:8-oxo-dGTP pyrophosphatase MutT (NUDIX family)